MNIGLNAPLIEVPESGGETRRKAGREARRSLPGWKKKWLFVAAALLMTGAGIQAYASIRDAGGELAGRIDESRHEQFGTHNLATDLAGLEPGSGVSSATAAESFDWSPLFYRLGFGFFLGFAVGYALRVFLKATLLVAGVILLAVTGLSYAGVVQVDWMSIQVFFDDFISEAAAEASEFRSFVMGDLPGAGSAALGLLIGFKRN